MIQVVIYHHLQLDQLMQPRYYKSNNTSKWEVKHAEIKNSIMSLITLLYKNPADQIFIEELSSTLADTHVLCLCKSINERLQEHTLALNLCWQIKRMLCELALLTQRIFDHGSYTQATMFRKQDKWDDRHQMNFSLEKCYISVSRMRRCNANKRACF